MQTKLGLGTSLTSPVKVSSPVLLSNLRRDKRGGEEGLGQTQTEG